jgi:hypothetical protein
MIADQETHERRLAGRRSIACVSEAAARELAIWIASAGWGGDYVSVEGASVLVAVYSDTAYEGIVGLARRRGLVAAQKEGPCPR